MSPATREIFFFSWAIRPADPVLGALGHQHDARAADQAVHHVELGRAGDALGQPPVALELLLQQPAGGAGLALGLAVHRGLRAAAEDEHARR